MFKTLSAVTLLSAQLTACSAPPKATPEVDPSVRVTLLHGGPIITMEADTPTAEAVVIEDDRIAWVGAKEEALRKWPTAEQVDLAGKTLMPGLIEQHLHPVLGALTMSLPILAPEAWELPEKTWPAIDGHEAYMSALTELEASMSSPDETLWTWGFNPFFHGELDRKALDAISNTRPIAVWHRSAHEFYINTPFIEKYGIAQDQIDAMGPEVKAQADLPNGHFWENGALVYLLSRIAGDLASEERMRSGLEVMVKMLHANGVTAYMEPGAFLTPDIANLYKWQLAAPTTPMYSFFIPESHTPYLQAGADGVVAKSEEIKALLPSEGKLRFLDKQVKILFDGAIISQLMQMKDGYTDGHEGAWIQPPAEVEDVTKAFWDAGYQIHVHTNGDEAMGDLVEILERRLKETPREDHRFTIVHFANSTDEQVKRLSELGAIISANPYYVTGFSDKFSEVGLGPERAHAMVRLGTAEALGMSVSLHSDMPMAPADPLYLAWSAVTRKTHKGNTPRPDLALSRDKAIRAITIDAAYSWQMEDEIGSIKPGKIANFTVLDQNPYEVAEDNLKDIEVYSTFFEGVEFVVP